MTLRAEKALVSLALAGVLHPTFQGVAAWTASYARTPPAWLETPVDHMVPVVPAAVWVYLSWYPATAAVLRSNRTTFRRAYAAYLLAFAACLIAYAFFPVGITRPSLGDGAGLSVRVLRSTYEADLPVNLFPSFHAAVAAILWRLRPSGRVISAAVSAWAAALCLACVLTKQHYVLDVVAGLVMGGFALEMVDMARRRVSGDDARAIEELTSSVMFRS